MAPRWVRFEVVERAQNVDQDCFQEVGVLGRVLCGFVFLVIFGRELAAKLKKAVEIFDGAAMEALSLGLDSQQEGCDVGPSGIAIEAEGEPVGAVWFSGVF